MWILIVLVSFTGFWCLGADDEEDYDSLGELSLEDLLNIELIGSRRLSAGFTQVSATPYDILTLKDIERQSSSDLNAVLRNLLPAYNVATQPNLDEASFMRPANLRGLAPDHMMVLANGKRRHRGALLTFLGSGLSDGAQGVDLAAIPRFALKSIQVLRDGAAAQYGSDAIAGILNLEFKDHSDGLSLTGETESTGAGDGDRTFIAGNYGAPLRGSGFWNLTFEVSKQDRTERQVQRADAAALAPFNPAIEDPAQTWGRPDIRNDVKLLLNSALPVGENSRVYSLANYARRTVDSVFYYRTPNGVDRPSRYSNDGGLTLLVGDLNPNNDINPPVVAIVNGNPLTSPGYDLVAGSDEFFAWTEVRPGGFTPVFSATIKDQSFLIGWERDADKLQLDVSAYWGQSDADLFLMNSMNPSNPFSNPDEEISPGSFVQTELNLNADASYSVAVGLPSDLVLSAGLEWREEEIEVGAGDPDSYTPGILADQGFRSTVDGYAGIRPEASGSFSRSNVAVFTEAETDVTERWLLGLALRWEDFEDFGDTLNYKLGTAYQINDALSAHLTLSSGFRAPTPGQSNIQRTSTVATTSGVVESGILPPASALAVALSSVIPGAPEARALDPEESDNYSLGFNVKTERFTASLDFYHIDLYDRITLSPFIDTRSDAYTAEQQAAIDRAVQGLVAAGVPGADTINSFQFFINDFDTVTEGVDLNAAYTMTLVAEAETVLSLNLNVTETEVQDRVDGFIDPERVNFLENGLPDTRFILTLDHQAKNWFGLLRIGYFGDFTVITDASDSFDGNYGAKTLTDLAFGVRVTPALSLRVGVDNLFDTEPDQHPTPAQNSGSLFPEESPFGFHGSAYYLRLKYKKPRK